MSAFEISATLSTLRRNCDKNISNFSKSLMFRKLRISCWRDRELPNVSFLQFLRIRTQHLKNVQGQYLTQFFKFIQRNETLDCENHSLFWFFYLNHRRKTELSAAIMQIAGHFIKIQSVIQVRKIKIMIVFMIRVSIFWLISREPSTRWMRLRNSNAAPKYFPDSVWVNFLMSHIFSIIDAY